MDIKPFFTFHPADDQARALAEELGADLSLRVEEADHIMAIGGDGTIMHAFANLPDLPVYALKYPESKSRLFNGHAGIVSPAALQESVNAAKAHTISALEARLLLSDGSTQDLTTFGDVVAERFAFQAFFTTISDAEETTVQRMGGDRIIFATPLGSTALNKTNNGHVVDIEHAGFVVTAGSSFELKLEQGNSEILPSDGGAVSRVVSPDSVLKAKFISAGGRRPVQIGYDGKTIMPDGQEFAGLPITIGAERHVSAMEVRLSATQKRRLLLDPQRRTEAHLEL